MIARFADMCSWRHTQYRRLMARIQKYIVGLKKEYKRLRDEEEKKEDPYEKKERKKIVVEKLLRYIDEGQTTFGMKMKEIKGLWVEDEEEGIRIRKVQRC